MPKRGAVRWRYRNDRPLATPPAIADVEGIVDGTRLLSLRRNDGTRRWRFQTRSISDTEAGNWLYAGSAPAIGDGTVYFGAPDERVYAVETAGDKRWEFWTWNNVTGKPVVAGDTVCVGSDDSIIYAFDAASGARQWEFATNGRIDGTGCAVVDSILYVSTWDDGLYALEEA